MIPGQTESDRTNVSAANATDVPHATCTRRRVAIVAVAGVLIIASLLIFWSGARRVPTPPASGTSLKGEVSQPRAARSTLRVGTFNIHSGFGSDDKRNLARTSDVVKECDLVGLQEVRGGSMFGGPDEAEVLGKALGTQWLFAPSERQRWHDSFGNAVLSHLPVTHWQRFPLSAPWANGWRTVLLLRVPWDGKIVNVLITHLDKSADRGPELRAVSELFRSLAPPAVLLADLNTYPSDSQLDLLRQTPGVVNALDRPGIEPVHRVDWIFAKGLRCVGAGENNDGTSDHPFFWADLAAEQD